MKETLRREGRGARIGIFFSLILWSAVAFGQGTAWEQRIEAGRKLFTATFQEAEKPGPEEARFAASLMEQGQTYSRQGKYAEAESLFRRALAIREKVLGPEHPDVARTLNSIAALYRTQGQHEKTEPLLERGLRILEKALGPEHPEVAAMTNNLAGRYRDQGQFAKAAPLYRRALALREKVLGPEHPDLVRTLLGMATFYFDQGNYAEAEPLYQRSLSILEKFPASSASHPNITKETVHGLLGRTLEGYAGLLRKTHRESEAIPMENRAKAIPAQQAQPGNTPRGVIHFVP